MYQLQETNMMTLMRMLITCHTYAKDAQDELKLSMQYKMGKFLPTINIPTIFLGTMDENGKPQDPAITIGPVSKRGMNLPSGKKTC